MLFDQSLLFISTSTFLYFFYSNENSGNGKWLLFLPHSIILYRLKIDSLRQFKYFFSFFYIWDVRQNHNEVNVLKRTITKNIVI